MSVHHNTYVMFGAMLPFHEGPCFDVCAPYFDDDGINPKGGVTVLFDGMNGEYIAVGHVIAKSPDNEGFGEPVSFGQVSEPEHYAAVNAALGDLGIAPGDHPALRWHVISHYE